MIIRKEKLEDYNIIYSVVKEAFKSAEYTDGNEQDLVNKLRKSEAYIPELSLVAEIDKKIVGHIMFTKVKINTHIALALAPLSVLPQYQKQGIGKALINEGHKIAKELGYEYSIVLGSEKYYPKMGYVTADTFKITAPFDVPKENFMAYKLNEKATNISGIVTYAKEFGIN